MAKKQKTYSREYKLEAVKLAKELGSASQAAKSLGISVSSMCKWINEYQNIGHSAFPGKGNLPVEGEELRQLRQQVKRLEMEKEILKKAITFFGNQS